MSSMKSITTYLEQPIYRMLKKMSDEDVRSMSNLITVLILQEGEERGYSPSQFEDDE